jgi:hypothetical protein
MIITIFNSNIYLRNKIFKQMISKMYNKSKAQKSFTFREYPNKLSYLLIIATAVIYYMLKKLCTLENNFITNLKTK